MSNIVYPLGYSRHSALIDQLMQQEQTLLIDIRSKPWSKIPKYCQEALKERYRARYRFAGQYLGNVNYNNGKPIALANPVVGIAGLVQYLKEGKDLVILCGCSEYSQCHRKTVIDLLQGTMPDVEVVMPDNVLQEGMMKTISTQQPFFWIIMNGALLQKHGIPPKLIENRVWTTKYRGPAFLRAGSFDPEFFERKELVKAYVTYNLGRMIGDKDAKKLYEIMPKNKADYVSGGIAGQCKIVGILDQHEDDQEDDKAWKVYGQYGLVLDNIEPLPFVATKGAFRLFDTPVCHCCSMPVNDGNSEIIGDEHKKYRLCVDCIK